MNAQVQNIVNQASKLSDDDRRLLISALHESLPEHDIEPLDPIWDAEIARRVARIHSGESAGIPWEEAERQIFGSSDDAASSSEPYQRQTSV